jgi:hypothetical protein
MINYLSDYVDRKIPKPTYILSEKPYHKERDKEEKEVIKIV